MDEAYDELSVDGTTVTVAGLERASMEKWGNRYSKWFLEKTRFKAREGTSTFRTLADTTVGTAGATSGALSLVVTDTATALGYASSGTVLLDSVPVAYSAFAASTMTVTALPRAFLAADTVQYGYPLPTDFGKARALFVAGQRFYPQKYGANENVIAQHYCVYGDSLFLPPGTVAGQDVTLHYYKKATDTLTEDDTMEILQMWDAFVILKLAARGHLLLHDQGQYQVYELDARRVLDMARGMVGNEEDTLSRAFIPDW